MQLHARLRETGAADGKSGIMKEFHPSSFPAVTLISVRHPVTAVPPPAPPRSPPRARHVSITRGRCLEGACCHVLCVPPHTPLVSMGEKKRSRCCLSHSSLCCPSCDQCSKCMCRLGFFCFPKKSPPALLLLLLSSSSSSTITSSSSIADIPAQRGSCCLPAKPLQAVEPKRWIRNSTAGVFTMKRCLMRSIRVEQRYGG